MYRQLKLALLVGALLGLGAAEVASAADMAVKARPVVAPILYNWQGCYLGANAGGAWDKVDTTQVGDDVLGPVFNPYGREKDSSFIGGGQAGCDFLAGKDLVFGIQSTFDFGNVNGRHQVTSFPAFSETNSLKSILTATGRIGYLFTPQFLAYGKFGVAYLQSRNQVLFPGGAPFLQSTTFWQPGLTAGVGVEWMFAPHWSVFAEWNYIWTEDDFAQHFNGTPGVAGETLVVQPRVQTALVGVNYKFNWDNGPVVAKY